MSARDLLVPGEEVAARTQYLCGPMVFNQPHRLLRGPANRYRSPCAFEPGPRVSGPLGTAVAGGSLQGTGVSRVHVGHRSLPFPKGGHPGPVPNF